VAEDAAQGDDERQAGGQLQRGRGEQPTGRGIGEAVANVAQAGQRRDGEGEDGDDGGDERQAHSEPTAVGEEGDRRRLVRCERRYGEGTRCDRGMG